MSERDGERVLEENRRLSKQADALAAEAKRQRADLQAKAADLQASTLPPLSSRSAIIETDTEPAAAPVVVGPESLRKTPEPAAGGVVAGRPVRGA